MCIEHCINADPFSSRVGTHDGGEAKDVADVVASIGELCSCSASPHDAKMFVAYFTASVLSHECTA